MEKLSLNNLEIYRLACRLSRLGWEMYSILSWQNKKIIGDQFITSTDSVGANIAEGTGRFHYLDRIKFFYNARASLVESIHWNELMKDRLLITETNYSQFFVTATTLKIKLNNFISVTYKQNG